MQDLQDLALIVESHIPLVVLETYDEQHAQALLTRVALKTDRGLLDWSVTNGLQVSGLEQAIGGEVDTTDPLQLLKTIKGHKSSAIYILYDFHPYLQGRPEIVRHIKDIALAYQRMGHTLVFVSHELDLPAEIKRYSARFDLTPPCQTRLSAILREEIREWMRDHDQRRPEIDPGAMRALIGNLRGVNALDARRLIRGAIRDDGAITESDIRRSNLAKFELLDMDGLMSLEEDTRDMRSLGGLENLKQWLAIRRDHFPAANGIVPADQPRGILLTGVQGTGKSLAAKAVAGTWCLPLLRLDMGALYNKFIGETEKNLRKCLKQAELMAPCVLWVDEIEKGLAVSVNEDATSQRVLGTLLTWLAERQSEVFIVATANDISALPPELLRKGRLDEIFFVDLHRAEVRQSIFCIHLERRYCDPEYFDLPALAARSGGFSGAEIEQSVVAAVHVALALRLPLSTEHILEELDRTQPLSVTMAEKIGELRRWAHDRTVMA